jgi:hypothetical protein
MKEREVDWDCEVADIEGEYRKGLWSALAKRSKELGGELVLEHGIDPMCDEILTKIEKENVRIDADGACAMLDQENYWRLTGSYPTFDIRGEDEGK